uniref:Major facilitator superfamily (MFS) profile domain-containing protein n=1 Tax=Panagrolaimus sp. JU765 TaxID=591449 RepID=A0AC34QBI6_9BILA
MVAGTREPTGWKPIALDGGYGWVVVLGSFLIHVFADGFVYSFGVIAESLVKEFNATNAETSTVLSLLTGLMLAAGPVAGAVCNRIGCRLTTIIGAIIACFGCATSYYATSVTYLVGSVGIIMGTGFGFMYCPAIVIVTMYFEKYRALATGITVCGAGVGTAVCSEFNATNAETSTVLSLLTGLMLAAGPVAGAVCNRIGCRLTTIIGAIIACFGCATSYYATSVTYLVGSVGIIMGTGFGFMYCPAIVIVTMYFEKYRALATGITVCGAGVGTAVCSVVISKLVATLGWRNVFLIYAGVVLFCIPCGLLYRPVEFAPIYDDEEEEDEKKNTNELKVLPAVAEEEEEKSSSTDGKIRAAF